MDSFKNWLALDEQVVFVQTVLSEDWTQAGVEIGNAVSTPEGREGVEEIFGKAKSLFQKIDSVVGMKKFLLAIPKTAAAQVLLVFSVLKFAKNPTDTKALANVVSRFSEAAKLGIYSGATVPLGVAIGNAVMPGGGAVIGGVLAKAVTYSYFYMGQWADNNIDSPKFGEFAKKIQALMPKSMHHDEEPEHDKKPWYKKIF